MHTTSPVNAKVIWHLFFVVSGNESFEGRSHIVTEHIVIHNVYIPVTHVEYWITINQNYVIAIINFIQNIFLWISSNGLSRNLGHKICLQSVLSSKYLRLCESVYGSYYCRDTWNGFICYLLIILKMLC